MKNFPAGRATPRPIGNLVLKVERCDPFARKPDCYPGIIEGTVAGGALRDRRMAIALRSTPANGRTLKAKDFTDPAAPAYAPPGAYLALSNVSISREACTAGWASKLAGPDSDMRIGLPMRIAPSLDRRGMPRRFRSGGTTIYEAMVMHAPDAEAAQSLEQLKEAVREALESRGGCAMAIAAEAPDGGRLRRTVAAWKGWKNGEPESAGDALERIFSGRRGASLGRVFELGGAVDAVPLERLPVAPKTAASIDRGMRGAIALGDFRTGGAGRRIERALSRAEGSAASLAASLVLAEAGDAARAAFMQGGWKAAPEAEIRSFFARRGLDLPGTGEYGFAVSTASVWKGASRAGSGLVLNARALSAAVSFDAVPTFSDPNALNRYYGAFRSAAEELAALAERRDPKPARRPSPGSGLSPIQSPGEPLHEPPIDVDSQQRANGGSSKRMEPSPFGGIEV